MTYEEYKNARQKEFNSLPIFFAFSKEQFKKAMEERGLTEDDTDKIYRLNDNCFYLKKDADIIKAFCSKEDPMNELMKDPKFAESAFIYEMRNHEYAINYWQGDYDVCNCFGECKYGDQKTYKDYLKEMGYPDEMIAVFSRARKKYMKEAERYA